MWTDVPLLQSDRTFPRDVHLFHNAADFMTFVRELVAQWGVEDNLVGDTMARADGPLGRPRSGALVGEMAGTNRSPLEEIGEGEGPDKYAHLTRLGELWRRVLAHFAGPDEVDAAGDVLQHGAAGKPDPLHRVTRFESRVARSPAHRTGGTDH
jgi:hypothetical protein